MEQLKKLTTHKNYDKFDNKIVNKEFLLGRFYDSTISTIASSSNHKHNHKKFPRSKIRRLLQSQLKINDQINKKQASLKQEPGKIKLFPTYELYIPLHNLWVNYIQDLLSKEQSTEAKQLKILKSDFHGAKITILSSRNQTLSGITGIVIKQTLKTFEIIVKNEDCEKKKNTKVVLKSVCVFLLTVSSQCCFVINGSSLTYRPSDRIRHKFKFKKADQLNFTFFQMIKQVTEDQLLNVCSGMEIE